MHHPLPLRRPPPPPPRTEVPWNATLDLHLELGFDPEGTVAAGTVASNTIKNVNACGARCQFNSKVRACVCLSWGALQLNLKVCTPGSAPRLPSSQVREETQSAISTRWWATLRRRCSSVARRRPTSTSAAKSGVSAAAAAAAAMRVLPRRRHTPSRTVRHPPRLPRGTDV